MKRFYSSEVFLQQLSMSFYDHTRILLRCMRNYIMNNKKIITMKYKELTSLFMKKTVLPRFMLIAFFLGFTLSVIGNELQSKPETSMNYNLQTVGCNASVTAVDGEAKPINGTYVYYLLRIKNTGSITATYNISADNYSQYDENPDGSSPENNVDMNQQLENLNHNPFNGNVTLTPGETYDFYIKLVSPHGAGYDVWNGTRISAVSASCPDNPGSVVVYTYIPVPDGVIIGYNNTLQMPSGNKTGRQLFIPESDLKSGKINLL